MELRQKISFGLRYGAPQRNEPVLEAANFTFLRGWAKIAGIKANGEDILSVKVIVPPSPPPAANGEKEKKRPE